MMLAGYGLEYILDRLLIHFWFALLSSLLGYSLMWTICSRAWHGRGTYLSTFWAGVFLALLSHWIIYTYTGISLRSPEPSTTERA
jgi:predicted membrane protein